MLKFEEGQSYICIHSEVDWWTPGKEYTVFNTGFGLSAIKDDRGSIWHDSEFEGSKTYFKLKKEPFTPTIEIDFLIDYIKNHQLESNEIISFLYGHKKGQVFIHETLN